MKYSEIIKTKINTNTSNTVLNNSQYIGYPPGIILPYAHSTKTLPTGSGWLFCDGSSYNTITYANLFVVIGYTYGGSGANFNVPNLNNRLPRGNDGTLGGTGGSNTHTHTAPINTSISNHSVTEATFYNYRHYHYPNSYFYIVSGVTHRHRYDYGTSPPDYGSDIVNTNNYPYRDNNMGQTRGSGNATHQHQFLGYVGTAYQNGSADTSCYISGSTGVSSHTVNGNGSYTSTSGNNIPNYISMYFIIKT